MLCDVANSMPEEWPVGHGTARCPQHDQVDVTFVGEVEYLLLGIGCHPRLGLEPDPDTLGKVTCLPEQVIGGVDGSFPLPLAWKEQPFAVWAVDHVEGECGAL